MEMDGLKDYIYEEIEEYLDNPTVKQEIYEREASANKFGRGRYDYRYF